MIGNVENEQVCAIGPLIRRRSLNWWSRRRRWIVWRHRGLTSIRSHMMHLRRHHSRMTTRKLPLHVRTLPGLQRGLRRIDLTVHIHSGTVPPWLLMSEEIVDGTRLTGVVWRVWCAGLILLVKSRRRQHFIEGIGTIGHCRSRNSRIHAGSLMRRCL